MRYFKHMLSLVTAFAMLCCVQIATAQTGAEGASPPAASEHTTSVNLNTATPEELQSLKGIGSSKAQAIVAYRSEQGKFKSVEDLGNIKGFSEKIVAKLLKQNPNRIVVE